MLVLGPLLFLIDKPDLNLAIKHCKRHHFADDMSLFRTNAMLYKIKDFVNAGIFKKNIMSCLKKIFIMHVLYGDRMYAQ